MTDPSDHDRFGGFLKYCRETLATTVKVGDAETLAMAGEPDGLHVMVRRLADGRLAAYWRADGFMGVYKHSIDSITSVRDDAIDCTINVSDRTIGAEHVVVNFELPMARVTEALATRYIPRLPVGMFKIDITPGGWPVIEETHMMTVTPRLLAKVRDDYRRLNDVVYAGLEAGDFYVGSSAVDAAKMLSLTLQSALGGSPPGRGAVAIPAYLLLTALYDTALLGSTLQLHPGCAGADVQKRQARLSVGMSDLQQAVIAAYEVDLMG